MDGFVLLFQQRVIVHIIYYLFLLKNTRKTIKFLHNYELISYISSFIYGGVHLDSLECRRRTLRR